MGEFVKVAKTSEIPEQSAICVEVGGNNIALFHIAKGEFCALVDECPHAEGPLSEGMIEGDEVECPWHAARFKLRTGESLSDMSEDDAERYNVRVTGDDIEIEV